MIILEYVKLFLGIKSNKVATFSLTKVSSWRIPCQNWEILQTYLVWRQVVGCRAGRPRNYNKNVLTLYIDHTLQDVMLLSIIFYLLFLIHFFCIPRNDLCNYSLFRYQCFFTLSSAYWKWIAIIFAKIIVIVSHSLKRIM